MKSAMAFLYPKVLMRFNTISIVVCNQRKAIDNLFYKSLFLELFVIVNQFVMLFYGLLCIMLKLVAKHLYLY